MTLDEKIELATIMADLTAAFAGHSTAMAEVLILAKAHISDDLFMRVIDSDKDIQKHLDAMMNLLKLTDSELSSRH